MIFGIKVLLLFLISLQGAVVQATTEASFNPVCTHCASNDLKFESIKEGQKCLKIISQEVCQSVPIEERKTCKEEDRLKFSDTGSIVAECLKLTALSFRFIFDFLWHVLISKEGTNEKEQNEIESNSSKNYILTELYRAYRHSKGTRMERLLKAASAVGGSYFDLFWNGLQEVIEKEFVGFKCYKNSSQLAIGCSFLLGFAFPSGGAFMILKSVLKLGEKSYKVVKKASKLSQSDLQKISKQLSVKKLDADFKSVRATLKSKKLGRSDRRQVKLYLNQIDKRQLLEQLQASVTQKIKSGVKIDKQQIQITVLSVMTAGAALSAIKLSPKAVAVVSEELADRLAVRYVNDEIISKK